MDDWVTCDRGHEHWGTGGAAGLMLHHQDENGTHRYLMQQRSPDVDHGGTWAPPSGALGPGEHPVQGALREAQEELGPFQSSNHEIAHTNDHGGWAFHTVTGDVAAPFDPTLDHESQDAAWLTPEEIDEMPLHPGFRESWNDLRPQPKQRFAAEHPSFDFYHFAPTEERARIQQHGLQAANPAVRNPWLGDAPTGVYLNAEPRSDGDMIQQDVLGGRPHDIWRVNVPMPNIAEAGVPWQSDPHSEGFVIPHNVPPEWLSLHQPWENTLDKWSATGEVLDPGQDEGPSAGEILDHLTLSSVAHNLHYKYESAPLTIQEANEYAGRLLDMMGYRNPDPMMVSSALQAWQQLYPGDKQLEQGPDIKGELNPPAEGAWQFTSMAAPEPPNFREGTDAKRCGNCKMFFAGKCWGYGNKPVGAHDVCDSWAKDTRQSSIVSQRPLYHWTDASNLHEWMDPSHTGPGETYLTEHGDAPDDESWNPDVPMMSNPVRLTINHDMLDPDYWDKDYRGWLNNYLYRGPIPPEAVTDVQPFQPANSWDMPEHWARLKPVVRLPENEGKSTEPQEVNNPDDAWPQWGEQTNDQKTREIQYGESSTKTV